MVSVILFLIVVPVGVLDLGDRAHRQCSLLNPSQLGLRASYISTLVSYPVPLAFLHSGTGGLSHRRMLTIGRAAWRTQRLERTRRSLNGGGISYDATFDRATLVLGAQEIFDSYVYSPRVQDRCCTSCTNDLGHKKLLVLHQLR